MWWVELLNSIVALLESGAGGGGGAYESISTITGNGSTSSFTFSSIPSTYKHLQIRWNGRTLGGGSTPVALWFQFNGDTTANYGYHALYGNGSSAQAGEYQDGNRIYADNALGDSGMSSGIMGVGVFDVIDYASTTKNKTTRSFHGCDGNTANTNFRVYLESNRWRSNSAVTSITVFAGSAFTTDSVISLYGIKGA
jgi:hypothetical protein